MWFVCLLVYKGPNNVRAIFLTKQRKDLFGITWT